MAERKVLNKYYPPDFDPAALKRVKKPKKNSTSSTTNKDLPQSRIMLPISISCSTCNEYIYKGKKFNARKEESKADMYLNIRVWRFIFKCSNCSAEIWLKTDPKNADYIVEHGAHRNYEVYKEAEQQQAAELAEIEQEEKQDVMVALEHKRNAAREEMERNEVIEELRERNAQAAQVDASEVISSLQQTTSAEVDQHVAAAEAADEAEAARVFSSVSKSGDGKYIKRVTPISAASAVTPANTSTTTVTAPVTSASNPLNKVVVVKKRKVADDVKEAPVVSSPIPSPPGATVQPTQAANSATLSSLVAYASSDDDD